MVVFDTAQLPNQQNLINGRQSQDHNHQPLQHSKYRAFIDLNFLDSRQYFQRIFEKQFGVLHLTNMADYSSQGDITSSKSHNTAFTPREDKSEHSATSSRARRKLGRTGSKSWFNKSFDQTMLQQNNKPTAPRAMRRQNSVTDFFQNMFSKSKCHFQDIFTPKKEKSKNKPGADKEMQRSEATPEPIEEKSGPQGAVGGQNSTTTLYPTMKSRSLHNSCPTLGDNVQTDTESVNTQVSLDPNPKASVREKTASGNAKLSSHPEMSDTLKMFMVTRPDNVRSKSEDCGVEYINQHRPVVKKSSLQFSGTSPLSNKGCKSPTTTSLPSPSRGKLMTSPTLSPNRIRAPKIVTLSSHDSSDSADEGQSYFVRRNVSSAPPGRQSLSGASSMLATYDMVNRTKRALVKSNSDTFAKLSSSPQPLSKASSDGNCFKVSPASSLASSMTSVGNVMISVTDYLFLGSIEAAYNEPLLCKYGISSLIDMTNINPALVPPQKKSDCPCACVNKNHFRSKLNIGVDDIEWENLEQYFDEINIFIHGARKKGRRVLVFSYMGQSRAAAAVIQHLMHHFKMPYREAMKIVRSKRPQIKLNSGFVKALRRLEKKLGLQSASTEGEPGGTPKPEESPMVPRGSVETLNTATAPPVVRGAWLEC